MNIREFVTYSFSPNVGPTDRVLRMTSGAAIATAGAAALAAPWWGDAPAFASAGLGAAALAFGAAWFYTGAVSRCGVYYLSGMSTLRRESTTQSLR
jgi:hypothetical protein